MRILGVSTMLVLALAVPSRAVPVCGNGMVEAPEVCDDGNLVDGDGCDSNCTPTGCGNGIVTAGEECDDGNLVSGDCCSATCMNENLPPDCSGAAPSTSALWPPNHKLVPVSVAGVTDPDGDPIAITVTAITQNEPVDSTGDGATCPDGVGVGLDTASLRSERSGNGSGRVYRVAFQATDRCNAVCTGEVTVCVPHDQGHKATCEDGDTPFDSTAGTPPCEGPSCGPEDCVPDPGDMDACKGDDVPPSVTVHLDRAHRLLARMHGRKNGKGLGRAAVRQLDKAARLASRAAAHGALAGDCASALADAVDGAGTCAQCRE